MLYTKVKVNTAAPKSPQANLLIIYTGGTVGMVKDKHGSLVPFNFQNIIDHIPALKSFQIGLAVYSFNDLIDSSNVKPNHWIEICQIIRQAYDDFDGFIILHGTDTMAFTASALSFMMQNLTKPVIFTGAQLPVGVARSDAQENLVTAIEISLAKRNLTTPMVTEVAILFSNRLIRANRAKKTESVQFDAFESENYPLLAEVGTYIHFNEGALLPIKKKKRIIWVDSLCTQVGVLKLFPGISQEYVKAILGMKNLKGLVLETYGAGNAPTDKWFIELLKNAIDQGIVVINISQCIGGRVIQGQYATSAELKEIGVLSGADMTFEAATTKMMVLLGQGLRPSELRKKLVTSICGELFNVENSFLNFIPA